LANLKTVGAAKRGKSPAGYNIAISNFFKKLLDKPEALV